MGRKLVIGLLIVVVIGAGLYLSGGQIRLKIGDGEGSDFALIRKPDSNDRLIIVTGWGAVLAAPDVATLSIGVETFDVNANTALDENNSRMSRVMSGLKSLGLTDDEIQTSGFSLSKAYLDEEFDDDLEPLSRDGFIGYEVGNNIRLRTSKIDLIEQILDNVVGWGATKVGSLGFSVEDESEHLLKARDMAVRDATGHAEQLASSAGVSLGSIVDIRQNADRYSRMPAKGSRVEILGSDAPLFLTTETIRANVTVTFRIES